MEPTIPVTWSYPQFPTTERGRALHLTVSPCGNKFAYASMNNVIIRDQAVGSIYVVSFLGTEQDS